MDRQMLISGLIGEGIKKYFEKHPVRDNTELLDSINDKLEALTNYIKSLAEKPVGETVIELDTKEK